MTLVVVTYIDGIALTFNRRGKSTVAGLIITAVTEVGLLLSLLATLQKEGVDFEVIVFFPLLVQGIVVAVSTLPPLSVLPILVLNCGFTFGIVAFSPYSSAWLAYMHQYEPQTLPALLIGPLTVFLIVAFVSLIWVMSANDAIKRADKADARAEFERQMALYEWEKFTSLNHDLQVVVQIIEQLATDPTQEITIDQQIASGVWKQV
jgi:hypothetical protein